MAKLRKQYHTRRVENYTLVWDVHRLIRTSRELDVIEHPLAEISELDENWWSWRAECMPTPRALAEHMRLVQETNLNHPVILCADGRLMDGMHRVVRAVLDGKEHIRAVRFPVTPDPDFVDVSLDDLPYPDEDA